MLKESLPTLIKRYMECSTGFKPSYEFFVDKLNRRQTAINNALPNNSIRITDYTPDWNDLLLFMDGEIPS